LVICSICRLKRPRLAVSRIRASGARDIRAAHGRRAMRAGKLMRAQRQVPVSPPFRHAQEFVAISP
ncbi:TPA: hypothetical protein ACV4T7_005288, partial [Burkholderia ambifaria]